MSKPAITFRCPHCGREKSFPPGDYVEAPYEVDERGPYVADNQWCAACRKTFLVVLRPAEVRPDGY